KLARACAQGTAPDVCSVIPPDQRAQILGRAEVRDAAAAVEQVVSTYVKGTLEIATNLGIPVPDWANKAVVGIDSAAKIVGGIASDQPGAVMNGLIGLTGLFHKAQPSQELTLLRKIDKRLDRIDMRLQNIEQTLKQVLAMQQVMLKSLGR